ncbi:DMBT1 protein, partial [Calyptomena viridis]|nr:DMBT1 protein [Calyptomena viridis]
RGSGVIWLDETNCTGAEPHLSACPTRPWGVNNCYHGEDAGVVCSGECRCAQPPLLRLANGSHRCAGRVELLHLHRWGGVCARGWSQVEAQVLCRHLGCGTALPAADFGVAPGQVWLEQVKCQGSERSLGECRSGTWSERTCEGGKHAGVVCS